MDLEGTAPPPDSTVYDARLLHPFTCIVNGPTGSGKSTFVTELLTNMKTHIDCQFRDIIYITGSRQMKSSIVSALRMIDRHYNKTQIRILNLYDEHEKEDVVKYLSEDFIEEYRTKIETGRCCVIFDDLMSELAEAGVLVPLFTKISSHYNLSVILLTQNIFHKTGGKHASDHTTLYRNTHYLVLFKNPLDSSIFTNISRRIDARSGQRLADLLQYIACSYRYVLIDGRIDTPKLLRFRSDLFNTDTTPHQKLFSLQ